MIAGCLFAQADRYWFSGASESVALSRALQRVKALVADGEHAPARLTAAGREEFAAENSVRLDYFDIVDPATLDPVAEISGGALVVVAAYIGPTRLIDNILLSPVEPPTVL